MTEPRHIPGELVAEIKRRVSIVQLVARKVKLKRAGNGFQGLCPFHQEKRPSFTVSDDRGFYHCFGCGAHGDLIEFVQHMEGLSFPDAVRSLDASGLLAVQRTEAAPAPLPERERAKSHEYVSPVTVGRWLWSQSVPARGELVEAWLRSRGLDPNGVPGALDELRFHPCAPWSPWRVHEPAGSCWISAPAMVAGLRDAEGHVRAVHVTYLAPDGRGKARFPLDSQGEERVTRKIFGPVTGHAVWLLGRPDGPRDGKLLSGEGIETTWAVAEKLIANGQAIRAAAALNLDNLQGHSLRDAQDAVPLWNPQADFSRGCFTIPDPGEVVVLVDADMKPIERLVQDVRGGKRVKRAIGSLERAELCANLGCQQWRHAGATRVSAVRPRLGMDFNDALRADDPAGKMRSAA